MFEQGAVGAYTNLALRFYEAISPNLPAVILQVQKDWRGDQCKTNET